MALPNHIDFRHTTASAWVVSAATFSATTPSDADGSPGANHIRSLSDSVIFAMNGDVYSPPHLVH